MALLVMDVQAGIVARYAQNADFLTSLKAAIEAARAASIPVIYVVAGFRPGYPEISPRTDGVMRLFTGDIRRTGGIVQNDQNGHVIQSFFVDVEHVPIENHPILPNNPAHAGIHTVPQCPNKSVFRKLSEKLALLASKRQWEIEPQEQKE